MLNRARDLQEQLRIWRRDFHMYPELGFQETRTSAKVAEIMEGLGYRVRKNVGRTGVVAEFGSGKPFFAIRADMDALPILETNRVPYASQNTGVMHACGHDSHLAMALGAAVLLSDQKSPGTVRFLFQPSEEVADNEGVSGAPRMIQDGAMEGVELIIALHVEPTAPVGSIRIKSGPASGGVDSWFGEIIGKGAHGAHPHQSVDPFYLMTQVIPALNAIVSRRIDPFDPAVVSVGSVHGGFTENVIPEKVRITGTLRYTKKSVQEQIHAEIKRAFEIARILGGDYELKIEIGSSPLFNSPQACELIASAATELLGKENLLPWKEELGAEDFGSYLEHAPGAMFALGTMSEKFQCQLHSPDFDLDEACLPIGAAVLATTALKFIQNNNS